MQGVTKHIGSFLVVLAAIACLTLLWWYKGDFTSAAYIALGVCGAVLVLGTLFYNLSLYFLLVVGFIPISIEAGLLGGAKLAVPSEGLLLLALPVLFLFNTQYRQTIARIIQHPISIFLLIDLALEVITSLTSAHVDVSLKRVLIRFIFISGFFVIIQMISNKKQLIKPWLFYVIGLVPVMLFTFRNHMHHSFNPRVVFSICQPYFPDHTSYGACLAFVIPLLVIVLARRKTFGLSSAQSWLLGIVTLLVILAEIFALSRAAVLSLVVAGVFYLLLRFKLRFRGILIMLGIFGVIAFGLKNSIYQYVERNEAVSNDGQIVNHFSSVTNVQSDASNLERINRWVCAIRMFEERPLTGFGPGTYQFEYNQFQTVANKTYISTNTGDKGNAHSEYLTYLSEMGIFGIIIFLLTVFGSVYFGMQNHELLQDAFLKYVNLGVLLGLITYYFHGVFNAFMDQSKMGVLYFMGLGTIVWINQYVRRKNAEA